MRAMGPPRSGGQGPRRSPKPITSAETEPIVRAGMTRICTECRVPMTSLDAAPADTTPACRPRIKPGAEACTAAGDSRAAQVWAERIALVTDYRVTSKMPARTGNPEVRVMHCPHLFTRPGREPAAQHQAGSLHRLAVPIAGWLRC